MIKNSTTQRPELQNEDTNILIVDDEDIVREVMKGHIAAYGYSYSTASDGLEAIKKIQEQNFDIIITDINMPNMDGMELLQFVKENYPNIGVIVVTGLSEEYTYVDVISSGAIDYMTKPFYGDELHAKLRRVIREQTLVKELEQLSILDPLTNIFNRRYFDKKILEETRRGVRQNYSVFLCFIDVDNFKNFNDTLGHQAGDQLLITIGEILVSCAREDVDYVFRFGGDEFALIITQTTVDQAVKISERIRTTFLEHDVGETSLSFGINEFVRNSDVSWSENVRNFVNETDNTLYEAKNTGRNKIIFRQKT